MEGVKMVDITNMTSWEMQNKAKELLAQKFPRQEKEEKVKEYGSYAEEKANGNVTGMLHHKLNSSAIADKGKYGLAKEYMQLSITEIQQKIKTAKYGLEATQNFIKDYLAKEEKKAYKEIKAVAGMSETSAQNQLFRHMEKFKREDPKYTEYISALSVDEREYNALVIAKENYLQENKDLIEAEKQRVARERLLKSGVLEELGITEPEEA
jgi:Rps23 Pro-64 3,4-dihydroxylase Tpa1-like proline 4-hydroxylase